MKTIISMAMLVTSLLFITELNSQNLETQLDEIVSEVYTPNEPGMSILVAKSGKPIYRKAFGKASLELDVNMTPNNVFEIGSITKQFTAVAILMLEEQGKLKVEDEMTKYIPDYPTLGKRITIHHLLNHTSGIKSYTAMDLQGIARTDMTPVELIDYFKNEPMDFDPGTAYRYNNSGYILLGHIIEVVTGDTYENFIEQKIFKPLGMNDSYYGSMKEIIKNRANGYQQNEKGYSNADYLSLTLPYAAGSIMSSIDDLLKWQNAISANTLIKRSSLEKAINGSTLNNGEKIQYGYGWQQGNINGTPTVSHGGGIFGYTTMGIYVPESDVYVIGLTNCNCKDATGIVTKVAAQAIGKPFPNKKDAITLNDAQLNKWIGTYQFEDGATRFITLENGTLKSLRKGSRSFDIYPMSEAHFIFENGDISYYFSKNNEGKRQVRMVNNGNESIGVESNETLPSEKKAIKVAEVVLKNYVGKYQLQPGFDITVTLEDGKLFGQATGQGKNELFAETNTKFFLKVVPAELVFNINNKGVTESLTLHQGGRQMEAKRVVE